MAQGTVIDLPAVRANIVDQLLNPNDSRAPLLDHIWKSNGGAVLPRDAANGPAQVLARRLADRIDFDSETATFTWPIVGFADPASLRFAPGAQWEVFRPCLIDQQITDATINTLEANFVANASARPVVVDPLTPPEGLSLPPETLLAITGYGGTRLFVYTPSNCLDVAMKCYALSRFDDARVILSHALAQRQDPRFYYFRGAIEMLTGHPQDARMSALGYNASAVRSVVPGLFYERVNGPPAIQFRALVAALSSR